MELKKFKGDYNPKIDFKMLCHSNKNRDAKESLNAQIKVYNGQTMAITPTQIHLKKVKKVFEFLRTSQKLNISTIIVSYQFFGIDEDITYRVQFLVEKIEEYASDTIDVIEYATIIFKYIICNKIFNKVSREMAILIFNCILFRNSYPPLIFYVTQTTLLIEMMKGKIPLKVCIEYIKKSIKVTNEYNTKHELVTTKQVVETLLEKRKILEKEFCVKHITIYGSLARNEGTIYSDLDVIVTKRDDEFCKYQLTKYLEELFKMPIDIITSNQTGHLRNISTDFKENQLNIF